MRDPLTAEHLAAGLRGISPRVGEDEVIRPRGPNRHGKATLPRRVSDRTSGGRRSV